MNVLPCWLQISLIFCHHWKKKQKTDVARTSFCNCHFICCKSDAPWNERRGEKTAFSLWIMMTNIAILMRQTKCAKHSEWVRSLNIYRSKPACTPESTVYTWAKSHRCEMNGKSMRVDSSCMSNLPSIRSTPLPVWWAGVAALTCASAVKSDAPFIQWSGAHWTRSHSRCEYTHWPAPGLRCVVSIFHRHHQHTD